MMNGIPLEPSFPVLYNSYLLEENASKQVERKVIPF